jgi:hypothetical protein
MNLGLNLLSILRCKHLYFEIRHPNPETGISRFPHPQAPTPVGCLFVKERLLLYFFSPPQQRAAHYTDHSQPVKLVAKLISQPLQPPQNQLSLNFVNLGKPRII